MKYFCLIFLLSFLKMNFAQAPGNENKWVLWNVGQGLWATHIRPFTCNHYDFGGEIGSFKRIREKLLANCAYKQNRLNLSHWHADHFVNLGYLIKAVPDICWESRPLFTPQTVSVRKILAYRIRKCEADDFYNQSWAPLNFKSVNESSSIFFDENVLLPGDSPKAQEKYWLKDLKNLEQTRVLVLGHHGSYTSSSRELIQKLRKLKFAIASARRSKYGHPHRITQQNFDLANVPILTTEHWGNIWF